MKNDKMSDITFEDVKSMSKEQIDNLSIKDHEKLSFLRREKKENEHKNDNCTAQSLRTQVLSHGVDMIKTLQNSYIHDEKLSNNQMVAFEHLWPIITNLVAQTDDLKRIKAKTASDVISAVTKGKMTAKEGKDLMSLMQSKFEMEELTELLEKMDELNI